MKTNRLIFSLVLLAAGFAFVPPAGAAPRAGLRGILISASNAKGATDARLAAYEPTLRRILRFESYRYLGEDRTSLNVSEKSELLIGDGLRLEIETEKTDGQTIHIRVQWITGGGRGLMTTSLVLRPGVPAVLGGPATGNADDVYAVILIGQ